MPCRNHVWSLAGLYCKIKQNLAMALRVICNVGWEDEGMNRTARHSGTHNTCKSQGLFIIFLSFGYTSQSLHFSIHGNGVFVFLSSS